jgi:hypothetical protein
MRARPGSIPYVLEFRLQISIRMRSILWKAERLTESRDDIGSL